MGEKHLDKVCAIDAGKVLDLYKYYEDNVNKALDILYPGNDEAREAV